MFPLFLCEKSAKKAKCKEKKKELCRICFPKPERAFCASLDKDQKSAVKWGRIHRSGEFVADRG